MVFRWTLAVLALPFCARPLAAQVTVDAFTGTAFNLHTPLTISQAGQPEIHFTAHYKTRPMEDTPYFGARFSLWKGNRAYQLTVVHHKLYLENPPDDVQWFRITYGFNMATLGLGWRHGSLSYTVGAGAVVTHASNSVRGRRYLGTGGPLNKGYTFSGVTAIGSAQYKLPLSRVFYLSAETMLSASYIEVKVNEGRAEVPSASLHLHAGFGYSF
jgi:hypothetical protein